MRVLQIFIFGFTAILVYLLAKEIFGHNKIARYSALFVALCPPLANYPSYLLVETFFTFLLCLTIFMLTKAAKSGRVSLFILSGFLLGITTLCKGVTVLFFPVVFLGLLLLRRNFDHTFKKISLYFVVFILAFMGTISPWMYRNYKLFNYFNISLRGELALWMRANKLDDTWEDTKHALVYNFSEYLGKLLYPQAAENPADFIEDYSRQAYGRQNELRSQNYNIVEANKIMSNEALQRIKEQPFKYLAHNLLELEKMTAFMHIPTLNQTDMINKFYGFKKPRLLLFAVRGLFRLIAYPLILAVILGICRERKSWYNWYFPLAIVVYINLIYSFLFGLGRYSVPLIPFYAIFAAAGIAGLQKKSGNIK